jgi:hypothetical protein
MRPRRSPRHGEGTAWLVVDRCDGDYLCYWYAGADDAHLVEWARARTRADALAWGRQRTPRVRIRTAEARTYWAGTGPRPQGFTRSWTDAVAPPSSGIGQLLPDRSDAPDDRPGAAPYPAPDEPILSSQAGEAAGPGRTTSGGSPC